MTIGEEDCSPPLGIARRRAIDAALDLYARCGGRRSVALALSVGGWSLMWAAGLALLPHVLARPGAALFALGLALVPWSFVQPRK